MTRLLLVLIPLTVGLLGCVRREPREVVLARTQRDFLHLQIVGLEGLIARAERGDLVTLDQIAIGVEEKVVKDVLNATLPREIVLGGRLRVRVESAEPFFRGNQAALLFRARAASERAPSVFASVELGGGLDEFQLSGGRLTGRVKLGHFALLGSSAGPLGALAEELIRRHLPALEASLPPVEIPVQVDEAIRVGGARMGPVTVVPGELPIRLAVSQVVPVNGRLWILLDAGAGPWRTRAEAGAE